MVDSRSEELTLGLNSTDVEYATHGIGETSLPGTTAWLDNGSYAIRQPHTSNSTELRFSNQVRTTSSNFMASRSGSDTSKSRLVVHVFIYGKYLQ